MTIRLEGPEAIDVAEAFGLPLCKYADPTEDARTDLTVNEARRVATEQDVWLIYLDVVEPHILLAVARDLAHVD
jgi:hypothetical protein